MYKFTTQLQLPSNNNHRKSHPKAVSLSTCDRRLGNSQLLWKIRLQSKSKNMMHLSIILSWSSRKVPKFFVHGYQMIIVKPYLQFSILYDTSFSAFELAAPSNPILFKTTLDRLNMLPWNHVRIRAAFSIWIKQL